jgi:biotin carboxylase
MHDHKTQMFIAKPSAGKGGEGISLVAKFKDLPKDYSKGEHKELLV